MLRFLWGSISHTKKIFTMTYSITSGAKLHFGGKKINNGANTVTQVDDFSNLRLTTCTFATPNTIVGTLNTSIGPSHGFFFRHTHIYASSAWENFSLLVGRWCQNCSLIFFFALVATKPCQSAVASVINDGQSMRWELPCGRIRIGIWTREGNLTLHCCRCAWEQRCVGGARTQLGGQNITGQATRGQEARSSWRLRLWDGGVLSFWIPQPWRHAHFEFWRERLD